uniref:Uncharacterized protein n=1 Tax=Meloidogyne enterolobii TaxID=390850 RepID=A0A6V7WTI2_MELEN|nr:unnamed protein product [Meloidogyne enterolobii]
MKKLFFIFIYLILLINGQEIFKENNYNLNPSFILDEPPQNIISNSRVRPYRRFILDEKPRFAQQNYGTEMANWRKEIKKNQNNNLQFNNNLLGNNLLFRKPLLNYFSLEASPEKVFKEMTGMDLRSILGPVADHLVQTTTPISYTRPIMKNKFVDYGILSLDNFLNGRFRSMQRIPYLLEKEKMLKLRNNETSNTQTHEKEHEEEEIEGSGEEEQEEEKQIENKNNTLKELNSSIKGIPKTKPFIPKIPLLNFNNNEKDELINTKINKNKQENKVVNEIMENNDNNLINMEEYQYGAKPNMQQGILNTLLDFFGVKYLQGSELDKVLTDWIMENTPKYISKSDKRAGINTSSYDVLRGLLSQPVLPLCSSPPQLIEHFNLDAFMGQWFEVMYSRPLISAPLECTTFSFRPIFKTNRTDRIGSLFEIVKFSIPPIKNLNNLQKPKIISGHAILSRPGQIILKNTNEPEEINVNILDAGYSNEEKRYDWAILGINCNYPIKVIARDPITFNQKYSQLAMHILEKKGLINKVSHILKFVTNTYPDSCKIPTNLFI